MATPLRHNISKLSPSAPNDAEDGGSSSSSSSSSLGCFVAWHKQQAYRRKQQTGAEYTSEDMARDMNALSVEERQAVIQDIHGVPDLISETPAFIRSKVDETKEVLQNLTSTSYRAAWDRASYLRPELESSDEHFLIFLRAKKYNTFDAANWLLKFYDTKREVWGEDLLVHRITWDDLTPSDQAIARTGPSRLLPKNNEESSKSSCPDILYYRNFLWDVTQDPMGLTRVMMYSFYPILYDADIAQRKGLNVISDFRGKWKATNVQYLQYLGQFLPLIEATPAHASAVHLLMDDEAAQHIIRPALAVIRRSTRIRIRVHAGSWTEIRYSLKTFGIDIPNDSLDESSSLNGVFSQAAINRDIDYCRELERKRRLHEAPYRNPASPIALYPNPQDILMGNNKKIAPLWPGNVAYYKLLKTLAPGYLAHGKNRAAKTAMILKVMDTLQRECQGRFLVRKDNYWEIASDAEIQIKVSQALRNLSRKQQQQMTTTTTKESAASL